VTRRASTAALLATLALACVTGRKDGADPCARLPLLARYEERGVVQRWEGSVRLHLLADLHQADCGTPDCYGTELIVALDLRSDGPACRVARARVWSTDYARCGPGGPPPGETRIEAFREATAANLADPHLDRLELRQRSRALVLLPQAFYWFDSTEPGAPLNLRLASDADATTCCFGATSSAMSQ